MKNPSPDYPDSKAADILAAGELLFARFGYDGVSMSSVAQEAGVSKANVFHHFGSKDELYLAVLQHVRRELTQALQAITAAPAATAGENLRQVGSLYLNYFLTHRDCVRLFMREMLERRPGHSKAMAEKVFGNDHAALTAMVRAAQARRETRDDISPVLLVSMLMAACTFYFQSEEILSQLPGGKEITDPDTYINKVVDILLHGSSATGSR